MISVDNGSCATNLPLALLKVFFRFFVILTPVAERELQSHQTNNASELN